MTEEHPILRPARLYGASIEPGYLRIDDAACRELASQLHQLKPQHWLETLWQSPDLVKLQWLSAQDLTLFLTVFHTIGFCYWPSPRWTYNHNGTTYDGANALLRSLYKLCDIAQYRGNQLDRDKLNRAARSLSDFRAALGGHNALPLLNERYQYFKTLLDLTAHADTIEHLLTKEEEAISKVFYISETLPGFNDTSSVAGFAPIPFLKRAQLLTSDIDFVLRQASDKADGVQAIANGAGLLGIDRLTAFADYKVPQILRHRGVLVYGTELANPVDNQKELKQGSQAELAIRVFTLLAVEQLRLHLTGYTASQIDSMLWSLSQQTDKTQIKPYHRTVCTNY